MHHRQAPGQGARARRADDEVVLVDGDQRATGAVRAWRQHDARIGKSLTEIFSLDAARSVDNGHRYKLRKSLGQIGAAGGDIKCCHQASLMVMDGSDRAGKPDIARMEMLVAMDRQRALFNDAGADAVGAFALFAPDSTGPKPQR